MYIADLHVLPREDETHAPVDVIYSVLITIEIPIPERIPTIKVNSLKDPSGAVLALDSGTVANRLNAVSQRY